LKHLAIGLALRLVWGLVWELDVRPDVRLVWELDVRPDVRLMGFI
jgi:hypothetical protein